MINSKKAVEIVKEYFANLKGANIKIGERKLIDLLGFDVIKMEELEDRFIVNCEILENIFRNDKKQYKIIVSKKEGIIDILRSEKNDRKRLK